MAIFPSFTWFFGGTWLWVGMGVVHTVGSAAAFFFLGTQLKPLNNHFLSLLSVSGSFVLLAFLAAAIFLNVGGNSDNFFFVFGLPFFALPMLIGPALSSIIGDVVTVVVIYIPIALFPSIITWLGMVHKARQINKEKESDVRHNECE